MEKQARRIIEKQGKLMGFQRGLHISFFLKGKPSYHDHWVCTFSYRKDYPSAIKSIEAPTIEKLLNDVEKAIDSCLDLSTAG